MRVRRLGEGSSNITYDNKNSSIENNFLIKFQNFCQKHFLVTLYDYHLYPYLLLNTVTPRPFWSQEYTWAWSQAKWLGALVWTALRAEENRLGSLLDTIRGLLVHQSEPQPNHSLFVLSGDSHSRSPIHFCIDKLSRTNLSWLSAPRPELVLRCIPSLENTNLSRRVKKDREGLRKIRLWRWAGANWDNSGRSR